MNKTDVIRMAQEAGATIRQGHRLGVIVYEDGGNLSPMVLYRFAELVAKAERERAASICESVNNFDNPMTAQDCADSIRATEYLP